MATSPPPPTLAATSVTPSHLQQLSWVALLRLASSGQECGNGHGSGGSSRGVEFRHFRGENATQVCCEEGKPPCPPPPPPSLPPPPQSRLGFTTDVFTQAGCIEACTLLRQTTRHGSSQSARASTTLAGLRLQIATVWQAPRFFTQTPQPASDQRCSIPHIYCM